MSSPAIAIRGLKKTFAGRRALDHLDLTVAAGAVFGFLGQNGAGKTTTLRILLGLMTADSGSVEVLGLDPRRDPEGVRRSVGVLLENDGLYDRLSALANLEYHARIHRLPATAARARIEELLRASGLWERRADRVSTWSKGMRQKLAVARALLHRPRLLLLDEPFTGLDPVAAAALRADIMALAADQGVTILLTTHDLAHVEKACSEVAVIKGGRVIASGALDTLRGGNGEIEVEIAGAGIDSALLAALERDGVIASATVADARVRVRVTSERRARLGVELTARGVLLEELHTVRSTLEETFLSLIADEAPTGSQP